MKGNRGFVLHRNNRAHEKQDAHEFSLASTHTGDRMYSTFNRVTIQVKSMDFCLMKGMLTTSALSGSGLLFTDITRADMKNTKRTYPPSSVDFSLTLAHAVHRVPLGDRVVGDEQRLLREGVDHLFVGVGEIGIRAQELRLHRVHRHLNHDRGKMNRLIEFDNYSYTHQQ